MATGLTGDVELKRIIELINKLLVTGDLANYFIAIDSAGDTDTKNVSLLALKNILSVGTFRPTTEPVVSASVLTINMESNQNGIFEPRASTGTRTISSNFTLAFSNDSAADIIHATLQLTGTIIITMPATVDVVDSLPSFIAWDSGLDQLTVTAGTAEKIELDILTDKTSGRKSLIVSNKLAV